VRWRIAVGKRHRVEPRQIVGALANEGGLKRSDFGRIDIKPNFSLVEMPPDLSPQTLDRLSDTRISGILIDLQRDKGPAPRSGPKRFGDGARPPGKKPRHKHS
jgi:ATP-dependent RNA helicase DeaD